MLALLGAHHILHVSRIRVKVLRDVCGLSECTQTNEGVSVEWQCIAVNVKQGGAHLRKTFKAKSLSITTHGKHAVTLHEIQTVFQVSATNSIPEATDSTGDKLQMDVNEGDFRESRRKARNNSPDAAQRRRANKVAPTQQAMVRRNRLQATVAINYSLSLAASLYLLRSVTRNDAVRVEALEGTTHGQENAGLL